MVTLVLLFAVIYSFRATNGKGPSVAQASGNPPRGRGRLDNARAKGRTDSARKDPGRLPGIRTICGVDVEVDKCAAVV